MNLKLMCLCMVISNLKRNLKFPNFTKIISQQFLIIWYQNKTLRTFKFVIRLGCLTAGENEQKSFLRFHNRLCHLYLPEGNPMVCTWFL